MMHCGTKALKTPRLRLRRFVLEDAADMYKNYAADVRVTQFLSWPPYQDAEDVRGFLCAQIKSYDSNDCYHWAIEYRGEVIGSISSTAVDERNLSCEVGYCIGFDFWNQGIMSEALQRVIGFFFEETGMRRIVAKHDAENPASGRVMQKCGMSYEGRLKKALPAARQHGIRRPGVRPGKRIGARFALPERRGISL